MKAAFITLGCKVNQYESNAMRLMLEHGGFETVPPEEEADVYIVNSCTVTAEASRKSRQELRSVRRRAPGAVTVLTGCYPQAYADELKALTEADIILGNKTGFMLPEAIARFQETGERLIAVEPHGRRDGYQSGFGAAAFEGHTRAFIKIQDGCNRYCSYCIIPKSRGFSRSRAPEEIRAELTEIARNGYKEVVFVGINLSAYGLDTSGTIADALRLAEETPGIERVRLGSLEPDHLTDEVIGEMRTFKKFCPQFHLSLQSGCDRILKAMNRHYDTAEYTALCEKLKAAGVKTDSDAKEADTLFLGLTIVVTGTLPTMGRKEAEDLIRSMGGKSAGSVSKKTSFVVAGEDAGSKLTKAQSLGVPVIDEETLLSMIRDRKLSQ